MSSRFLRALACCVVLASASASASGRVLRVCADPDDLPFSNQKLQGFENKIAALIAHDLHAQVKYHWSRMGRGYVRDVFSKQCDVLIAIPTEFRQVLTTDPYYRSSYVFVTRTRGDEHIASLDDPKLRNASIGIQVLDDDYAPPARALSRRGLSTHVVGYESYGEEAGEIVSAVAKKKVDVAIVWGPLAGYFAKRYGNALTLTPVTPAVDPPKLPFTFSISMGVAKTNSTLRDELNRVLTNQRPQINRILRSYGVPLLPLETAGGKVGD